MKRLVGVLLTAVALTSCSLGGHPPRSVEPAAAPVLAFFDATPFDRSLSSALRGNPPTTTVQFPALTTLNAIPERFGSWLTMVTTYGGKVDLQPDPQDRTRLVPSLLSLAYSAFKALYALVEEKILYGPVRDYNATIYYRRDGKISQVVFWRKVPPPEATPSPLQHENEPGGN
jgi:hypothetical protein